ncbi:TRAP transporter small permease [Basfia succiniciproducens]|uniref:TRAP transporter small permease n=1 Tax=Basfia succiniciproducens TaxID=653940 RepID=UPI0008B2323E|nr:TRAP transporter small permease [Basfia succiniciproducens]SEQ09304.1 TRAP-type C4-dicarboxylate transport system, small permease component [Basfia succiniciproducens]
MKFLKLLDEKIEVWLINLLLANITFWIFYEVVMRYIFNNSSSWGEEFIRWCFIWFLWIGVSYGFKTRTHISVTAFVNLLPPKPQALINIIVNIFVLWCMVKFSIYGWEQLVSPIIAKQESVVLYWPFIEVRVGMQWLYASLFIGAILSAVRLLQNIYQDVGAFKAGSYTTKGEQ